VQGLFFSRTGQNETVFAVFSIYPVAG